MTNSEPQTGQTGGGGLVGGSNPLTDNRKVIRQLDKLNKGRCTLSPSEHDMHQPLQIGQDEPVHLLGLITSGFFF